MGRGRSSSGGSSRSSSSSSGLFGRAPPKPSPSAAPKRDNHTAAAAPHHAPAPAGAAAPPMPMQQTQVGSGGGMMSGLLGTVVQGMAFGTGSAVAHRAVDAIAGPRQVEHVHQTNESGVSSMSNNNSSARCSDESMQFTQCMRDNNNNSASCGYFFDILKQCQASPQ